jgi:hypothetical protein
MEKAMRLLLATVALALCMTPLGATEEKRGQAEPLGIGFGLMCDTPEQAKRLMALRSEGSEMPQAVGLVNQESADPSACGNALVVFRVLEEVHNARVDGKRVAVTKVVVSAISDGVNWARVDDKVQYALIIAAGVEI